MAVRTYLLSVLQNRQLFLFATAEGRVFIRHHVHVRNHPSLPAQSADYEIKHAPGELAGEEDSPEGNEEYYADRNLIKEKTESVRDEDIQPTEEILDKRHAVGQFFRVLNLIGYRRAHCYHLHV